MKVYVVTVGEYDDEYVWGVYSSPERAEAQRLAAEDSAESNQVDVHGDRWREATCVLGFEVDQEGPAGSYERAVDPRAGAR